MNLEEILNHRRAVRKYSTTELIDTEKVCRCLELALLAPTSSNMQLFEMYHITDGELLKRLAVASLDQQSATTAQEMVVFVVRRDLYRQRANTAFAFEKGNVGRNSPPEKQAKRIRMWDSYYKKLIPFLYARCFGLLGLLRKLLVSVTGLFRPIIRQVSEGDIRVVAHKSCALVAQTFMLAMSEQGYDTCPLEGFDSLRVKRILRLPCSAEINMIVSCGIRTAGGVWGERFRQPFETVYKRNI